MTTGKYVILDDTIDHAIWHQDHRFDTEAEAIKAAKKLSWKRRQDYYVAELITGIELNPDIRIDINKIDDNKTEELTHDTN